MKTIKILGTGCPNCKTLESNVKAVLEELGTEATVEKVEEVADIMSYDIMGTPGLVIDEKVVSSGKVLSIQELKEILSGDDSSLDSGNSGCCCDCNN